MSSLSRDAANATEIAGQVLLLRKTGGFPRTHTISGTLAAHGLVPATVPLRDLNRLLDHHTRGSYGFGATFSAEDVASAVTIATGLLAAARAWPAGTYHPPLLPLDE